MEKPSKPKGWQNAEDDQKKRSDDDENSVLNVLKRGFMPAAERADAEITIRNRQRAREKGWSQN